MGWRPPPGMQVTSGKDGEVRIGMECGRPQGEAGRITGQGSEGPGKGDAAGELVGSSACGSGQAPPSFRELLYFLT